MTRGLATQVGTQCIVERCRWLFGRGGLDIAAGSPWHFQAVSLSKSLSKRGGFLTQLAHDISVPEDGGRDA